LQINGLWLEAGGIAAAEQLIAVLTRDDALDDATQRLAEWMRARVQPLT
jgi:hypothetical protein